jgi:serine/threonine-protein kinase
MSSAPTLSELSAEVDKATRSVDLVAPGELLAGRYEIEGFIARGGMGHVYAAKQVALQRRVAIKVISAGKSDAAFARRFFLEAAVCARLSHPNIVTVHDYGELDEGRLFMAMEYLDGEQLSDRIEAKGALAPDELLSFSIQICRALREAHAHSVIHRDLKPGNIMILKARDEDGRESIKVLDFGLVKVFVRDEPAAQPIDSKDLTRQGVLVGSPRYMSPEQVRNEELDQRSDIYALGAIMYEMASGRPAIEKTELIDVLHAQLYTTPKPLEGVPEPIADVIHRCLDKDREKRPQTVNELLKQLKDAMGRISGSAFTSGIRRVLERDNSAEGTGSNEAVRSIATPKPDRKASRADLRTPESVAPLAEPVATTSPAIQAPPLDPPPAAIAAERPRRHTRLIIECALLTLVAGAATFAIFDRKPEEAPVVAEHVEPPAPPPKPKAALKLVIKSNPSEATVSEDGRVVGTTPLSIPLDGGATHRFEVTKIGFSTYVFDQGPATDDAEVTANLVALPPIPTSVPSAPNRTDHPRTHRGEKTKSKTPPKEDQPSDIRMTR